MELINVFDTGDKHAAWKYLAKSFAVLFLKSMTFMNWGECVFLNAASVGDFNGVLLFCLVIGMSHKTSHERLLLPCRINF